MLPTVIVKKLYYYFFSSQLLTSNMSKEFVSQWDISTMSSKCAVSIWSRLFLYKWWEQMAEIEINDFFSLLGNTMYIIKRLTVPTSGYRGLAHLPECSGHIKNPGHIKRGWCILWQYELWSFQTGGTILYFCIRINILRGNYWILRIGLMGRCQKLDIILLSKVI